MQDVFVRNMRTGQLERLGIGEVDVVPAVDCQGTVWHSTAMKPIGGVVVAKLEHDKTLCFASLNPCYGKEPYRHEYCPECQFVKDCTRRKIENNFNRRLERG